MNQFRSRGSRGIVGILVSILVIVGLAGTLLLSACGRQEEGIAMSARPVTDAVARVKSVLGTAAFKTCKSDSECPTYYVCRSGRCYAQ